MKYRRIFIICIAFMILIVGVLLVKNISIKEGDLASSSVNVGGEICPTGQAKSIEQYGITWYFDRCIEYGQFINGDYWVKGPATIQTITPVPINGQNGFDVNPRPYSYYGYKYTSNLDWIGNDASGAPQTLPRTLSAGSSLVSTITNGASNCTRGGDTGWLTPWGVCSRARIKTASVLTILAEVPDDGQRGGTYFRPAYVGTTKTLYSGKSLKTEIIPSLDNVGTEPSLELYARRFSRVQLDHDSSYTYVYMHPSDNMEMYGAELTESAGMALLRLALNDSLEVKKPLLIGLIQSGIDLYGMFQNGQRWATDGGHMSGRKIQILFAGLMLGNNDMKNVAKNSGDNYFGEDCQTFYTPDNPPLYSAVYNGTTYYSFYKALDTKYRTINGYARYGITNCFGYTPQNYFEQRVGEDGGDGSSYWGVNYPSWKAEALAIHLYNMKEIWAKDAFLDLMDRAIETQGFSWNDTFIKPMWEKYRHNSTPSINSVLSISKNGSGIVTGTDINCGLDCDQTYLIANNTSVTLTAHPPAGHTVIWNGGGCSGNGLTCGPVLMTSSQYISVTFSGPVLPFAVGNTVSVKNASINVREEARISSRLVGTQSRDKTGIIVDGPITDSDATWWKIDYASSDIDGWGGEVNLIITEEGGGGTGTPSTHTLNTPSVNGNITKKVGGIVTIGTSFPTGTSVELTATPNANYTFSSWTGCTSSTNVCTTTMDTHKNVTANFVVIPTGRVCKPWN